LRIVSIFAIIGPIEGSRGSAQERSDATTHSVGVELSGRPCGDEPEGDEMVNPTQVLIVDDAPGVCWSIARTLRRHGFKCMTANSGAAALSMLKSQPCDLVLADIRMPGNENLELVREARRLAPEIPVILMTGHPSLEIALSAIDHSVTGFLVKPFDAAELIARISQAVEHHQQSADSQDEGKVTDREGAPDAATAEGETHLLSVLVPEFLEHYLQNSAKETVASYGTALDLLARFCAERTGTPLAELAIEQIKPELVTEFILSLSTERGCGFSTCAARVSALRSFFRYLIEMIPGAARLSHATKLAEVAPRDEQPEETLSAADIDAIAGAPNRATPTGRRDFAALLVLTRTTLNAADLIALDRRDLQLEPGKPTLSLRRRGRVASLRLQPPVALALREMFEDRKAAAGDDEALFVSAKGQRLTRDSLREILRHAVDAASTDRPWLSSARTTIPLLRRSTRAMRAKGGRLPS
jgi:DNA-binding response OmpR family regulator